MVAPFIKVDDFTAWKSFIKRLIKFLEYYKESVNSYILDFFTDDHWNKFPLKWQYYLKNVQLTELAKFLNKNSSLQIDVVAPLSLLAFRKTCFIFSLPRISVSSINDFAIFLKNKKVRFDEDSVNCNETKEVLHEWKSPLEELSLEGGQHRLLEHVFRKHLKPKKQHEVLRLSQLAAYVVNEAKIRVLIDVGCGQGHLSRLLSYRFKVTCLCLDMEETFIEGARKFDQQLEYSLKGKQNKESLNEFVKSLNGPKYAKCHLSPDTPVEHVKEILKTFWPNLAVHSTETNIPFGFIGLHSCGDLAPTLLRFFTSIKSCRALLSIGCCYVKLSTKSENSNCALPGYPLSSYVQGVKGHELSYCAREMSCHAIEAYAEKLRSNPSALKVHCYRAILEEIIVRKNPSLAHLGLRSVKNAHLLKFHEYATSAVAHIDGLTFSENELISKDIDNKLSLWMRVVVYYSIRLMLAPVIETLILLDRLLFLYENGYDSVLAPIFDPVLSPRNYVLVAKKSD